MEYFHYIFFKKKFFRGFTLIELLISIAVVGVLATVTVVSRLAPK